MPDTRMTAAEIRQRFLDYFGERQHRILPSSSLVPEEDPTLLFTNSGMVQFKKVFLGMEERDFVRAVTSQKCVRAGGKHNDLEEVGRTARHHTFFEMLGNFSFGDYFKRDAIAYAWEFLTVDLGLDPDRLYATVHDTDDEAAGLWEDVAGVPPDRIYRLGDEDNFWQMADTGPCGPCSELLYDVRPEGRRTSGLTVEEFAELGERGDFLELWNLVFMQYDRDEEGTLHPLPAPSIDTGAGLERLASVLQDVPSVYDTDLFQPLLERVSTTVGRPYQPETPEGTSARVLADHARAVAFLLADGVFPSSEGRGYVLRRILRRAVRHAWMMGRREPTLVEVVDEVVEVMGDAFPELRQRREHLLKTTRAEEDRFLTTIDGGMSRFDEVAPASAVSEAGDGTALEIPGAEAFRLYDTFGFPLDLTELMAGERGYTVDVAGFEEALESQRDRSRADRASAELTIPEDEVQTGWKVLSADEVQEFVGYTATQVETEALAIREDDSWMGVQLRENPFYLEAGGQVSDGGEVSGEGWRMSVQEVRDVNGRVAVLGPLEEGAPPPDAADPLLVQAAVPREVRHDTERNHTATHLLHAALRAVLGKHVVQKGSLVAPDRLRFDFAHTAPLTTEEREDVQRRVNESIWADHAVVIEHMPREKALEEGAMALFGEKYDDTVRVVLVAGVSMELCGGTHCRHTGEIGLFQIVSETGVAAGVRRIEATTGPGAFAMLQEADRRLKEAASALKTPPENVLHRIGQLVAERDELESLLEDLRREGGSGETVVVDEELEVDATRSARYMGIRLKARDPGDVRTWGDGFLASASGQVAVVAAEFPDHKHALFAFVTDDLISLGVRADAIVREVAAKVEGTGGGRPHMAQAGVGRPEGLGQALEAGVSVVRGLLNEEG